MSTAGPSGLGKRLLSQGLPPQRATVQKYVLDPVKLIAIPITNKRIFLYHKHSSEILNMNSRIVRYETKITEKARKIWSKLEKSPREINQKLVRMVNSQLDKTPWTEDSLNTVPSEGYILKTVMENQESRNLTYQEWFKNVDKLDVRPVCMYYPQSVMSERAVREQLKSLWDHGLNYHKKQMWLSILGLPLTLPVVLVPVVPNVPGFYLLYRAYRNFKAFCGAKHLKSLVENKSHKLVFTDLPQFSDILRSETEIPEEHLVLNEKNLERVLDTLQIHELRAPLEKAVLQERKRLDGHRK
ncbi:hypothetical protein ACU8KH_05622 [Lachancea thermotolerans]